MKIAAFLIALALAGCGEYRPSSAKCFSLVETTSPCNFELLTDPAHLVVVGD